MLPVKDNCSDSFSECGSIDSASPWSAMRKVLAAAAPASPRQSTIARTLARSIGRFVVFIVSPVVLAPRGRKRRSVTGRKRHRALGQPHEQGGTQRQDLVVE